MGKINFKPIGTFEEFCQAKEKQLIKESNEVAIDVPFYNEAVASVITELHLIAGDPTIELNGKELKNNGDEHHIFTQAKRLFAHEIAKEETL